jgi:hypothetical protein
MTEGKAARTSLSFLSLIFRRLDRINKLSRGSVGDGTFHAIASNLDPDKPT